MKQLKSKIDIANTTAHKLPSLPFASIKDAVLGSQYELSFVVIGHAKSQSLNRRFRKKDYPTNILSFPLSKNSGEIYLDFALAKKEAPNFGLPIRDFVGFLVIHGMLHLKGLAHGSTMEKEERRFSKKFGIRISHTL